MTRILIIKEAFRDFTTLLRSRVKAYPLALYSLLLGLANRALIIMLCIRLVHDLCAIYTDRVITVICTELATSILLVLFVLLAERQIKSFWQTGVEAIFVVGSLFDILHQAMQTNNPFCAYAPSEYRILATMRYRDANFDASSQAEVYNYVNTTDESEVVLTCFGEPFSSMSWQLFFFAPGCIRKRIYITKHVVHLLVFPQFFDGQDSADIKQEYLDLEKECLLVIEEDVGYCYGDSADVHYGNGELCQIQIFEKLAARYGLRYNYYPCSRERQIYNAVEHAFSDAIPTESGSIPSNETAQA